MKIIIDNGNLRDFDAWSGAVETKRIILENGKDEDFEAYVDECYPEGLTDTQLNDLLWFEADFLYEYLNIEIED